MLSVEQARSAAQALVERAAAAGADAADAIYIGERSSGVQVRLGELEQVNRSESEEIGLRLFLGRRSATAASSDLAEEALAALVERALAMAAEAPEDPFAGLAPDELLHRGDFPALDSDDGRDPEPAELRARGHELERRGSQRLGLDLGARHLFGFRGRLLLIRLQLLGRGRRRRRRGHAARPCVARHAASPRPRRRRGHWPPCRFAGRRAAELHAAEAGPNAGAV